MYSHSVCHTSPIAAADIFAKKQRENALIVMVSSPLAFLLCAISAFTSSTVLDVPVNLRAAAVKTCAVAICRSCSA
jgi:hypothetical protein